MMGANHTVLGGAGGFVAATVCGAPLGVTVVATGAGAIGGLLPDVDTQSSRLGRLLPKAWHKLTPGHRCLTHSSLYMAATFGIALLVYNWGVSAGHWQEGPKPYIPIAIVAGMFSHLFADSITIQGVPWFYPLSKRKIKTLGRFSIRTGSKAEAWVMILLIALVFAFLAQPAAERKLGNWFDLPEYGGIDTEPLVLFAGLIAIGAAVSMLYLKSRGAGPWDEQVRSERRKKRTGAKRRIPRARA